ncbi:hypothetical protein WISP_64510 [Willisornis vidua]|uniref:Uncharacterized protein n=1 Tax=Willisornis vidua TaxID=1566151 RepID=A0ABQ9DFP3_9PASS|nr:hypothetical protein WISP_64510 [Willisornis vidua]
MGVCSSLPSGNGQPTSTRVNQKLPSSREERERTVEERGINVSSFNFQVTESLQKPKGGDPVPQLEKQKGGAFLEKCYCFIDFFIFSVFTLVVDENLKDKFLFVYLQKKHLLMEWVYKKYLKIPDCGIKECDILELGEEPQLLSFPQHKWQDYECPEYPQPIFITIPTCILQIGHFIMRIVLIAMSGSNYSGNLQIFFAVGPNLQPKSF